MNNIQRLDEHIKNQYHLNLVSLNHFQIASHKQTANHTQSFNSPLQRCVWLELITTHTFGQFELLNLFFRIKFTVCLLSKHNNRKFTSLRKKLDHTMVKPLSYLLVYVFDMFLSSFKKKLICFLSLRFRILFCCLLLFLNSSLSFFEVLQASL